MKFENKYSVKLTRQPRKASLPSRIQSRRSKSILLQSQRWEVRTPAASPVAEAAPTARTAATPPNRTALPSITAASVPPTTPTTATTAAGSPIAAAAAAAGAAAPRTIATTIAATARVSGTDWFRPATRTPGSPRADGALDSLPRHFGKKRAYLDRDYRGNGRCSDSDSDDELKGLSTEEYRRLKRQKMRKALKFCIWNCTPSPPRYEGDELEEKAEEIDEKYGEDLEKSDSSEKENGKAKGKGKSTSDSEESSDVATDSESESEPSGSSLRKKKRSSSSKHRRRELSGSESEPESKRESGSDDTASKKTKRKGRVGARLQKGRWESA
ncbi:uncharacterized protein J3R85_004845 [Psidium guajava]|nr:uncharacterized protein J3R85_004845 [Psidium guajava]